MNKSILTSAAASPFGLVLNVEGRDMTGVLHVYAEPDQPQQHSDEELQALTDRLADEFCREFQRMNGDSPNTRLCGGCMAPLIHNVVLTLANRVEGSSQEKLHFLAKVVNDLNNSGRTISAQLSGHPLAGLLAALGGDVKVIELD